MIDYSIIIRTTGKSGSAYQQLLDSISSLIPKPKEVIVVLPEGYEKPKEQLGWETYFFCPKGMVTQRLFGINKCKTQYALICDDDVIFPSDFVKKLHEPIGRGVAEMSSGPLLSYLPPSGIGSLLYAITGAAVPRIAAKGKYITVMPTTGYTYYRSIDTSKHEYYIAESLPWTCFYGEVKAIKNICMEDELWLQLNGYASMDDQTMFYKAHLRGIRTVVVSDAEYEHLDAKTSRKVLEDIAYAMEFNRYVFWHRFIYSMDTGVKKVFDRICIEYYFKIKILYNFFRLFKGTLDLNAIKAKNKAFEEAKKFVQSEKYLKLRPVIENNE